MQSISGNTPARLAQAKAGLGRECTGGDALTSPSWPRFRMTRRRRRWPSGPPCRGTSGPLPCGHSGREEMDKIIGSLP